MMRVLFRCGISLWIGLMSATGVHADELVKLPTRQTEEISYWWMPHNQPKATVLLFSGGSGGIGYRDGKPQSANFLIRSRDHFFAQGLNVALVGNPSDKRQLDDLWRVSREHMTDVQTILADVRKKSPAPVWVVGTSRGTISAAAIGIGLQEGLAGVVLTASMTQQNNPQSVPRQALEQIRIPVLVVHHKDDACYVTKPHETPLIMRGLTNAPVKRLMMVSGGSDPRGNECEALHWHGFIGMEEQVVRDMALWMFNPQP
ncbi:MAG: hypothetical protein RL758_1645 [Pseudomonadota bacterium]|jgi:pimeloyl-ACP methyl ester carboxylesterase